MATTSPAVAAPAGKSIVDLAAKHIGESYVLGVLVPKDNPNWTGPWDCAEFASWLVCQVAARLYGCDRDSGNPATADAYTGYWERDARSLGAVISLTQAASTPGAFVLRFPAPGATGHIVISDGLGGTIEAHSHADGVIRSTLAQRRWDMGILVPGIAYTANPPAPIPAPATFVYRLTDPLMTGSTVLEIQQALKASGFDPGVLDGEFGPHTHAAVVAFQLANRMVADGEVGPQTAAALNISLTPPGSAGS